MRKEGPFLGLISSSFSWAEACPVSECCREFCSGFGDGYGDGAEVFIKSEKHVKKDCNYVT